MLNIEILWVPQKYCKRSSSRHQTSHQYAAQSSAALIKGANCAAVSFATSQLHAVSEPRSDDCSHCSSSIWLKSIPQLRESDRETHSWERHRCVFVISVIIKPHDGCFICAARADSLQLDLLCYVFICSGNALRFQSRKYIAGTHGLRLPTVPSNLHFIIRQSGRIPLFEFHHHNARHSSSAHREHQEARRRQIIFADHSSSTPRVPSIILKMRAAAAKFSPHQPHTPDSFGECRETCCFMIRSLVSQSYGRWGELLEWSLLVGIQVRRLLRGIFDDCPIIEESLGYAPMLSMTRSRKSFFIMSCSVSSYNKEHKENSAFSNCLVFIMNKKYPGAHTSFSK